MHLLRRAGVGVCFDVAPLLVYDAAQLALHCFERVVDHLVQRLMGPVVHLPFISDQLVASRHGHIDPAPARVSLVMGVIGLLDGHITAVDVVAKFFQSRRIFQNKIVDLVRFFQTPVRDLNRQLHDLLDTTEFSHVEGIKKRCSTLDTHLSQGYGGQSRGWAARSEPRFLIPYPESSVQHLLQISRNERNLEISFAGSTFTKSDFTCSTIRSRTAAGKRSTIAP